MSDTSAGDFKVRGYMLVASANYLREKAGPDAERIISGLPADTRKLIDTVKSSDWCDVEALSRVLAALAGLGNGNTDRSRDLLVNCGAHMAREATNTFLRILIRILTPNLFAKKIPDLWARDCNRGKLSAEVHPQKMVCRIVETDGFNHAVCTAAGFVTFALQTMGKSIEKTTIHGWALDKPTSNSQGFEIAWSN